MKTPTANKGFGVLEAIINIHVCMALNTGIQFVFVSNGFRQLAKLGLRFTSSPKQSPGASSQEPKYYLRPSKLTLAASR